MSWIITSQWRNMTCRYVSRIYTISAHPENKRSFAKEEYLRKLAKYYVFAEFCQGHSDRLAFGVDFSILLRYNYTLSTTYLQVHRHLLRSRPSGRFLSRRYKSVMHDVYRLLARRSTCHT